MSLSIKPALLFTLLSAVVLSSCSSDSTLVQSSQTQPYKLVIKPDSINGFLYQNFSLKARIDGVPSSDVRFDWDFGDGNKYEKSDNIHSELSHSYQIAGDFTIKVKGYDYFSDTIISQSSIPVRIAERAASVQLYPKNIDTIITMDNNGSFIVKWFRIVAITSLNYSELIFNYHIVGPELDTLVLNGTSDVFFPTTWEGPYTITTEVLRKSGGLYGRDTSVISIKMPPVNLAMIQSMINLTVKLNVDTATEIAHSPGFRNPLSIGLTIQNTALTSYSWDESAFSVSYNYETSSAGESVKNSDIIHGDLSSDLHTISSITVGVDESHITTSASTLNRWGFILKNLKLVAVTPNSVTYLAKDMATQDLIANIYFELLQTTNSSSGNPKIIWVHIIPGRPLELPNAIVTFSK